MTGKFTRDEELSKHRAQHIINKCEVVADGHQLLTLGAHTGHVWKVIAYCENADIASAIASALEHNRALKSD